MQAKQALWLLSTLLAAQAGSGQSMPGMPGMQHGSQPSPKQPKQPKPGQSMPGMPGMQHGQTMPGDKKDPLPGPAAQAERESERNSEQQRGQPGPASDAGSQTRDTAHLQEPENPEFHTGADAPAPLLLGEISRRAPLPLQDFLDAAEKSNPTLPQGSALVRQSLQQARQAGLPPNPQVGYEGEQIRGGSFGGGEQGIFVQQNIVLGGKLKARGNIYRQQAGSNLLGVEEQHLRIRDDVTQAFYTALASQAIVVERQKLLRVAEDAVVTAHQLANVGQADAPDVLEAEVEAEQAGIDFVAAQRQFLGNFQGLAAFSSRPDLPVSPLAGELDKPPALDAAARVAEIVANSPTVKRARQEVIVAEARLNDARREAMPDLLLRAGEQDNRETLGSGSPGGAPVRVGPQSFASVGVTLPLWNRNQGNIEAAKAGVERAREDVARTQLLLKQQAEPLAQAYETARFQADRYRDALIPRARRAYELYLIKYRQMAASYPQVLVSQRTLFQVQIEYLVSLQTVWTAGTALENYTLQGGLTPSLGSGQDSTTLNLPHGGASE